MALYACKVGGGEGKSSVTLLGTYNTKTINLSGVLNNYQDYTAEDFILGIGSTVASGFVNSADSDHLSTGTLTPTITGYDPSTGILTLNAVSKSGTFAQGGTVTVSVNIKLYVIG